VLGNRLKQQIDRWARSEAGQGIAELQPVPLHSHVMVGRGDGDHVGQQQRAIAGRDHRELRGMGQQIDDQTAMFRGEVLSHHIAHPTTGHQMGRQVLQRLQPSGRSADAHHVLDRPGFADGRTSSQWPHCKLSVKPECESPALAVRHRWIPVRLNHLPGHGSRSNR
jgi:hypothetical protein